MFLPDHVTMKVQPQKVAGREQIRSIRLIKYRYLLAVILEPIYGT